MSAGDLCAGSSVDTDLNAALDAVTDPEIPVTLRDLGVLRDVVVANGAATVTLSPTRLGCPALGEIARRVQAAAVTSGAVHAVRIVWQPREWQPADITPEGRRALRDAGYSAAEMETRCPYCGGSDVETLSTFGGSICRQPLHCRRCGTPFDVLRSSGCRGW